MSIIKEYTNGEITVIWEPRRCIHSAICINGLPSVFDVESRPWIYPEGDSSERIARQVKMCPSQALRYYWNDGREEEKEKKAATKVEVLPNGPLIVHGDLEIVLKDGTVKKMKKMTAFCRCGASENKPLCDGSHSKINFDNE